MATEKRTELSQIGEFGLINRLKEGFSHQNSNLLVKGIGDDAAVWDLGNGKYQLQSTDLLVEGVHFDLTYTPLKHLGYKAIAVNVSDIVAMNGKALFVVVGIAVSNRFSVEAIEEIYSGIQLACEKYNVLLVGGDTTTSRSGLILSVTVTGEVSSEKVTYRNTANVNDLICISGDVGAAYMGLQVLEREKQVYLAHPDMQPELDMKEYIIKRQLRPEARIDMVQTLEQLGVQPTAMIDVSDGLASELFHICSQSSVGAYLYEERIPIHPQTVESINEFQLSPLTAMLNGGEDYEIVFTVPPSAHERIRNHPDISIIGYITPSSDGLKVETRGGSVASMQSQGWNHFKP
ncbi:MAG: thiamine-phosphate kinase [Cytophagaceae bacterium]|nr:thiamine-phosphate kinase [Cytophagaceae bacterium]